MGEIVKTPERGNSRFVLKPRKREEYHIASGIYSYANIKDETTFKVAKHLNEIPSVPFGHLRTKLVEFGLIGASPAAWDEFVGCLQKRTGQRWNVSHPIHFGSGWYIEVCYEIRELIWEQPESKKLGWQYVNVKLYEEYMYAIFGIKEIRK